MTFSCSGARAGWDIDRACSPQITDDVGLQLFVPAPVQHIFIFLSDYAPDSFLAHSTYIVHVPTLIAHAECDFNTSSVFCP